MSIETKPVNGTSRPQGVRLTQVTTVERGTPAAPITKDTPPRPSSWRRTARVVWYPARGVWRVARHERTRTAGRAAVRHSMYVAGGARIVSRRAWDGRTAARYERMIRACEAAGNLEEAKEWEERGRVFREQRHRRRMDLLSAMRQAPKAAVSAAGIGAGGLLGLGIALAVVTKDPGGLLVPTMALIQLVQWLAVIAGVVWGWPLLTVPALAVRSMWKTGRAQQAAPTWTLPASQRSMKDDEPITPSLLVTALKNLGIAPLRKAILSMEDGGAVMLSVVRPAGCGVEVDVYLPIGVSTEEIQGKRKKLAENLHRHERELHITIPKQARTVRLWIADSGALDEPVPASPLVYDESITADYKTGRAPWGLDLRGDPALMSLYQMMLLVTGLSNQGKTAALRALALWLAFDPRVEFRIGDLKGIGDWRMFTGLATVLIEGPTDDHVMAVTHMVEDGFDEMNRRLTSGETDFPPLVIIVDEAQVAYGSAAVGPDGRPYGSDKNTSRYFRAVKGIHDQGRAVNVTIWEGTQDPTNQNLPKRSREGNHIRASLVVGSKSQAAMALGEDPVAAGAAPHKLRRGDDKGTLVVTGDGAPIPAGQPAITVRTHYIDTDTAAEVAERAKSRRAAVTTQTQAGEVEERDPLMDVLEVMNSQERVRTSEVLHRLKNLDLAFYRDWDGARLRKVFTSVGEDTGLYKGYPVIHLHVVTRALADRSEEPPSEG